jgi:NADPH2:quinone reductase
MTEYAIRIHRHGGPEELVREAIAPPAPGPGEVLLRHAAVGLNFIDVNHRVGRYPLTGFPRTIGMEGAGRIEALGPGVAEFAVGDRVGYVNPIGSYATARVVPADRLVRLPEGIAEETAAAIMLKGMTARYLLRSSYRVQPGDTILIHAAAGGVGQIACQWARALGATVIGTVGSGEKAEIARAHGCDHAIVYSREDFVARVRELTGGAGVPVVYDSVGQATFEGSLKCLRPLGLLVSYGYSSGKPAPFDLFRLNAMGSLYVTAAGLYTYTAKPADLQASAAELFETVLSGKVAIDPPRRYPLPDAARAHADLESRRTTGAAILLP